MGLRSTLLGALVAICAVALAAEDAQAFWGSRGSCGSSGGSWGGSWGSSGSHGGLFSRWRARRGSYGSSGSYGSAGSAGSHGSYGSHGGYAAASYSYGGEYVRETRSSSAPTYAERESRPTYAPRYVSSDSASVKTKLTLRVPADATVTLAGVRTKQTGDVREFSTTQLASGQEWSNYTVHVEFEQNGETIARDETITLTGGESQELSIGGDQSMTVAQL